jgi:simple sugar transport system permease protein
MIESALAAVPLLLPAMRQATPLVLGAMGGILSERAGVINIALEGMMVVGAFTAVWAAQFGGVTAGLLAALASGAALGFLHYVFTQKLRMNHVVSGVAINILALAACTYLVRALFNQADPPREARAPGTIPVTWFILLAVLLPFALHFLFYRTRFGLRLRAVGESPESARLSGIEPVKLRLAGVVFSGVLAASAGAYLALSLVGRFSDKMVSGRGFIALAAVIVGRWNPLGAAAAALAFGFFDSLQFQLQGNVEIPGELLRSLPYIATILVAMWLRPRPPAALGTNE